MHTLDIHSIVMYTVHSTQPHTGGCKHTWNRNTHTVGMICTLASTLFCRDLTAHHQVQEVCLHSSCLVLTVWLWMRCGVSTISVHTGPHVPTVLSHVMKAVPARHCSGAFVNAPLRICSPRIHHNTDTPAFTCVCLCDVVSSMQHHRGFQSFCSPLKLRNLVF